MTLVVVQEGPHSDQSSSQNIVVLPQGKLIRQNDERLDLTERVDVLLLGELVSKDLASEISENVWELLRNFKLLDHSHLMANCESLQAVHTCAYLLAMLDRSATTKTKLKIDGSLITTTKSQKGVQVWLVSKGGLSVAPLTQTTIPCRQR